MDSVRSIEPVYCASYAVTSKSSQLCYLSAAEWNNIRKRLRFVRDHRVLVLWKKVWKSHSSVSMKQSGANAIRDESENSDVPPPSAMNRAEPSHSWLFDGVERVCGREVVILSP